MGRKKEVIGAGLFGSVPINARAVKREYHRHWSIRRKDVDPDGWKKDLQKRRKKYRKTEKCKQTETRYRKEYAARDGVRGRVVETNYQWKYGITKAEFAAMVAAQNGLCAICGEKPSGKGHCARLHTDHDHETGKVRAALCHACNRAMGFFRHDPARLRAAAAYLESHI